MVKFIVTLFFFALISSCANNHNNNYSSSPPFGATLPTIEHKPKLLSKKDFPFVKPLTNKEITVLVNQIKDNPLTINQLTANQVLNLLGTPIVIKKHNNIVIWQFRSVCVLNIIWKKHKQPTSYYLNSLENLESLETLDSHYSISWLSSITNNKQSISPHKCFLKIINLKQGEYIDEQNK